MNHYPLDEERDWKGVCAVCGKMVNTIMINRLDKKGEREKLEKSRAFLEYLGLNDDDDQGEPVDYREITPCCHSEDFIPAEYAVRCSKCGQWYDRRFGKEKGGCLCSS